MILSALCIAALTTAQEPGRPRVELPAGVPFHVGQAIPLAVRLGTADPSASVVPPAIADAEIQPIRPEEAQALGLASPDPTSPDGGERRCYAIVPRKAGILTVLAFTIRDGATTLRTWPVRVEVRPVPSTGRPREFRGGIGSVRLRARVDPDRVEVGEWLEYRLRIEGPGVAGMVAPPEIPVTGLEPSEVRVEPPAPAESPGLFERTYRVRVRPLRSGRLVIGPVALATFDPAARRFETTRAPGVTVSIRARAAFAPEAAATPSAHHGREIVLVGMLAAVGLLAALAGATWLLVARSSRSRRATRARAVSEAAARIGRIQAGDDAREAARVILAALDDLLNECALIAARNPGPAEARAAVATGLGDEALAARVEALLAACVRLAFAPIAAPAIGAALPGEARIVAEALARRAPAGRSERRGESAG
jgi:hypothetical protein